MAPTPYSPNVAAAASDRSPLSATVLSPRERARVSSSRLLFLSEAPGLSMNTSTFAMSLSLLEQLLGGQEVNQLDAGVAFVGDDGARGPGRPLFRAGHGGPGTGEAHLGGVHADVGQGQRGDALALGGDDALEVGVPGFVDLVRDGDD